MRTTWQATAKDKIVGMFGYEHICNCPGFPTGGFLRSPETFVGQNYRPNYQWQVLWNRPQTNRLLFEAGSVVVNGKLNLKRFGATPIRPAVHPGLVAQLRLRQCVDDDRRHGGHRLPAFRPDEPEVRDVVRDGVARLQDRRADAVRMARHQLRHGARHGTKRAMSSTGPCRRRSATSPRRSATRAGS